MRGKTEAARKGDPMSTAMRFSTMLAVLFSLAFSLEAYAHTVITRISDRQNVSLAQLANVAGKSDLILIGESHDNKDHHDLQLDLIRSLWNQKAPMAIGLEMVQANSQRKLDEWTQGKLSEEAIRAVFSRNWSPDWHLYRDIFIFARDNRIPMIALNVPIEIVKKVSRQGYASLTPEERRGLPEGTTCDLSNPQIAVLKKSYKGVVKHADDGKIFSYFCEAQTVRNSGMAMNMASYLRKHPDTRIVTLTGIWHAVKYGIPTHLTEFGQLSYTVILPETPELNSGNATTSEVDYLVEL